MSYEKTSLSDLLNDALRKRSESSKDSDFDELFLDDDFFPAPGDTPEPVVDIDTCIAQTLEQLEQFTPDEKSRQIIREFLTFRLQVQRNKKPEVRKTFYNLLMICEEQDTATAATEILKKALNIADRDTVFYTEKRLLGLSERPTGLISNTVRLVLVYNCNDAPKYNADGSSQMRDRSAKEVEAYNRLWKTLANHVREHPETILIVSGPPSVYRSTMRVNMELSTRICAHHLTLHEPTVEQMLEKCLQDFRRSSFSIAPEFEQAMAEYFPAAYRVSELKGQLFLDDLQRRVYDRFFCQQREGNILTADCVPDDNPKFQTAEAILGQMNELIGLQSAKDEFSNIYKMRIAGLSEEFGRYHMLFAGNPGTGKTTVAKMAADLLYSMNVIKRNKVVVVKPSDMISEWIGGTGIKAMEVIRRAYNGVLFIDEAYGIANMDRGEELLNVLIQEMEENSDKLVVILAGYNDEMRELLKANPGLASRISRHIQFDNYTVSELVDIFLLMCRKDGFSLHPDARDELEDCINALMTKEFFGNAREIRNMLQDLKEAWSEDYYKLATEQGEETVELERVFLPQHFTKIMPPKKEVSIRDLIGLDVMKKKLDAFKQQALFQRHLREKGITGLSDFSMHMIFTGNPGTGKTTVAKLIADDLYSVGMLKTNRLVVAERKDLISYYGKTSEKTADIIRKAVGGVLFIDEAYSLADENRGGLGNECIELLLTAMEEHKADTVFIFAGYVEQMQQFLAINPGIQSRIGYTFHFEDYSPDELTRMFAQKMKKLGFCVTSGALKKVRKIMEYFQDVRNFGNGRFVDHVIHQSISRRASRDFTRQYRNIETRDIPEIKHLIETAPNGMHLYDPAEITPEHQRRTAIHELGHAVVLAETDPEHLPKSVSIRNHAGSLGRVTLSGSVGNLTEEELLRQIAGMLGGKNAERVFYNTHATGCSSDYAMAKAVAKDMIERFAMTTYGETPKEILQAADQLSRELIEKHRKAIELLADRLLQEKEMSGQDFAKALDQAKKAQ